MADVSNTTAVPRRRFGVAGRLGALMVAMTGVTVALTVGVIAPTPALASVPFTLPWWAVAIAIYVFGRLLVHLHMRSDSHTVSLGEIPLALGLFFAAPAALLVGQVVGDVVALAHGRQRPLKFAFNLAQYTLATAVTIVTFRALVGGQPAPDTPTLLAALVALLVGSLVGVLAVQAAIAIAQGDLPLRDLVEGVGFGLGATAATGCLALVGVALLWVDTGVAWLLVVPTITLWAAYRAYTRLRLEHGRLRQLFLTSQIIRDRADDVEASVLGLLGQAREILRAEHAAVVFPLRGRPLALQTAIGGEHDGPVMREVAFEPGAQPWSQIADGHGCYRVTEPQALAVLDRHLGAGALNEALIAPLRGPDDTVGYLLVAGRRSTVQPYDEGDLGLMGTLANLASAALERGRLQQRMRELDDVKEQLSHEVDHDPLTALANRRRLVARLDAALADRRGHQRPAVLYMDLDGFKEVNDTIGHHAGDALLTAVADRLREVLRDEDTAARLGGDEFAIVLPGVGDAREAVAVAARVLDGLERPVLLDGLAMRPRASVGVALALDGEEPDALLRRADAAMYAAKQAGGNVYRVAGDERTGAGRRADRGHRGLGRGGGARAADRVEPLTGAPCAYAAAGESSAATASSRVGRIVKI